MTQTDRDGGREGGRNIIEREERNDIEREGRRKVGYRKRVSE